jgi:hypothetical protein
MLDTLRTRLYWSTFVCGDYMIECDHCKTRVEAVEEFRASGDDGLAMVRALLHDRGWRSDEKANSDICPDCLAGEA